MARRRVNRVMGRSAGVFGFKYITSIMIMTVVVSGGLLFWLTGNFMLGMIAGLTLGALIQLVTDGKPGKFYAGFHKRPNWIRGERQYINEWSPDHVPRTEHLLPEPGTGVWVVCIGAYLLLVFFFSHLAVPGIGIFLLPFAKFAWRKFRSMVGF